VQSLLAQFNGEREPHDTCADDDCVGGLHCFVAQAVEKEPARVSSVILPLRN